MACFLPLFLPTRLLEHLIQRERDYQSFLQQTLEQKTQELYQLQLSTHGESHPIGDHHVSIVKIWPKSYSQIKILGSLEETTGHVYPELVIVMGSSLGCSEALGRVGLPKGGLTTVSGEGKCVCPHFIALCT